MDSVKILGVSFCNTSLQSIAHRVIYSATIENEKTCNIFPVNVDVILKAHGDSGFKNVLNSGVVLADGMPIVWLSKVLGVPLRERVAGSDLIELVCHMAQGTGAKMFLLGAAPEVAKKAATNVSQRYGINCDFYSPSREELLKEDLSQTIVNRINNSSSSILLVGLGAPLQEEWIHEHSKDLKTTVNIAVGGTIDFLSGRLPRAPRWMRKSGLEWLYRLLKEPRRLWKRYVITDSKFVAIAIRELVIYRGWYSGRNG